WVSNAAGVNAIAVAEHVMAFILSWYKNIPYLDNYMKEKKDEKKLSYSGSELADKTIGIIGVGAVGQKVAKYCNTFGMKVLGYVRKKIDTVENIEFVDLDTLYMKSDIVTVHVSLNDKTRHMINSDAFKKMKKTAIIINTARGPIIDEKALIVALKNGDIAGAGLDVFEKEPLAIDSELREFDNVILTPHTAGMPDGLKFHKKRYAFFIENIKKVIAGKKPDSALNKI
ncbi:MAG: hydroxyacid dehydrogenase, partial [Prevotellaceae bacterium]|nr:hydroxyacid dehydrogenase [Prevotellaceae bacterium]